VNELLTFSLLPDAIREALHRTAEASAAVAAVTESLMALSARYLELKGRYASGGLRAFEEALVRIFLEERVRDGGHPTVRAFFADVIDLRNVLTAYKHVRWEMEQAPAPCISGGRIPTKRLHDWVQAGNTEDLSGLTGREPSGGEAVSVEVSLLRDLTLRLRQAGRGLDAVGPILDYLWRRYTEMRNLRVLYFGKAIGPERLAVELIR
jgi:vacuolar-type H+-ATPase subunit C/Vma6